VPVKLKNPAAVQNWWNSRDEAMWTGRSVAGSLLLPFFTNTTSRTCPSAVWIVFSMLMMKSVIGS